jgi:hypothetical protein
MIFSLMTQQLISSRKRFRTNVTLKRLFACVHTHMNTELRVSNKSLFARRARIRPFLVVLPFVYLHSTASAKRFATNTTLVRSFTCMSALKEKKTISKSQEIRNWLAFPRLTTCVLKSLTSKNFPQTSQETFFGLCFWTWRCHKKRSSKVSPHSGHRNLKKNC